MGLLDFLSSSPEKRIRSLQKKVTERYGPPENRQKAVEQLLEMGTPEAISALLMRFTVRCEPSISDGEEKDHTSEAIVRLGERAVGPLEGFLRRSNVAVSWALTMLRRVLGEPEVVSRCLECLAAAGPEYTRDPEKKTVLIATLGELHDERITPALVPFLADPSDDVRIAAAVALARQKDERAREPLLEAFVESSDRARVVAALAAALADAGFGVQGYREKVEKGLPEGFLVDRAGLVKRRE